MNYRSSNQQAGPHNFPVLVALCMGLVAAAAGLYLATTSNALALSNLDRGQVVAQGNVPAQGTPTPTSTAMCPSGWTNYPNPAPPGDSTLYAVTAIGSNDLWAVGYYTDTGTQRPLTVHGDGTNWTQVPSPNPGSSTAALQGVDGVAPNDVWAVGWSADATLAGATLTQHWDGTAWSIVPSPNIGASSRLYAVTAIASNDVWAVGAYNANSFRQTLTLHWDGSSWTVVPSPNPGGGVSSNVLYGVSAVATDDVWAVGYRSGRGGTLIIHWDGSAWSIVPSPSPSMNLIELRGVAAVSANDVWAVGYYLIPGASPPFQTLVEHWDGSSWTVVPSPSPGAGTNRLYGVSARASNDVWVVGHTDQSGGGLKTLAEHWDGSAWTVVPTPDNLTGRDHFYGVSVTGDGVVWAVGTYGCTTGCSQNALIARYAPLCSTPTPTPQPCGLAWRSVLSPSGPALNAVAVVSANDVWAVGNHYAPNLQPLIEHWNGSSWSVVPSPPIPSAASLNGVTAVSANDVWAVGGATTQELIMHWDGTSWSVVPSPGLWEGGLTGVAAVSANDVWAVGSYYPSSYSQTLIEHWNGSSWSVVTSPNLDNYSFLNAVAVVSANDIWAVGRHISETDGTLIIHWDGTSWSIVPSPSPGAFYNNLRGVTAVSSNDVWAVGDYANCFNCPQRTVIEHWDGSSWSIVPSPNPDVNINYLYGVEALAANDIWAVGYYGGTYHTLILHWDGSSWSVVPGQTGSLYALAALTNTDIWAVGSGYNTNSNTRTMHYSDPCGGATVTPTNTPVRTPTRSITSVPPTFTSTTAIPSNTAIATPTPCTLSFTDVPPGSTFYPYITCLACRSIVSGYNDGTFRPNNEVTRGQLSKIVSGAAGFMEDPGPQIFHDVPPDHTFYVWINRLTNRGYMTGYTCGGPGEPCINNRPYFRPSANATRGQTSKIVSNAARYNETPTEQTFEDVPPTHTFYREIQRLASRGIMGGYPCGGVGEPCTAGRPYFRPQNDVTRGQSAKIVANTFYPDCQTP